MQPERLRCPPTQWPIEAGGYGPDRIIETHYQKHDAQRCLPLSIPNNRFLSAFRGQAPGITLRLSMDTRIDLPGDRRHCNISQSMSISRCQFQDRC